MCLCSVCPPNEQVKPHLAAELRTDDIPDPTAAKCRLEPLVGPFIARAKEAGYTNDDANQFYNDVVTESATENVVDFLLRRPDCFGPGVVKKMQNAINPYNDSPNLVESHRSKVAIPQCRLSANDQ